MGKVLRFAPLLLLPFLLLAACGGGTGGGEQSGGASVPEETTRRAVEGLRVETVATGLDTPWEIAFAPDGTALVTERPGRIRAIEGGELQEDPYVELDVEELGEGGQLGLALHPDFEENGFAYAYYTTREDGEYRNRLVRLVREDGKLRIDEILLTGPAASIHNGGRVAVSPDEKLYATFGDTSEGTRAQALDILSGKIIRLNLDGSIPEDNPFEGSPVYSYGHRNPQGLAWDGEGNLYATEHGPSNHDELNLIRPGNNYGWPRVAGEDGGSEYTAPVLESGEATWAPSGAAYIEEGPWAGSVVFAGLGSETLFRAVVDPEDPGEVVRLNRYLEGEYGRLRTVKQGPDGALYVLTSNRDGRGSPAPGDDRVLKVTIPEG